MLKSTVSSAVVGVPFVFRRLLFTFTPVMPGVTGPAVSWRESPMSVPVTFTWCSETARVCTPGVRAESRFTIVAFVPAPARPAPVAVPAAG